MNFLDGKIIRIIGLVSGLVLGILFLTIGFLKTLLLAACAFVGWIIGTCIEDREAVYRFLERILPRKP